MTKNNVYPSVQGSRVSFPLLMILFVLCSATLLNACSAITVEGGENSDVGEVESNVPTDPQTPEECEQLGGRWEVLGFSGPGCNLPSLDGGKVCSDHSGCESLCLVDDESVMKDTPDGVKVPDHFRIDQINAEGKDLKGVCSEWQSDFGCHAVIEKGKIVVICID